MNNKQVVLKFGVCDDKIKRKAVIALADISGFESIEVDMKNRKITVTGDVNPGELAKMLKKACRVDVVIDSAGKKPGDVLKRIMAFFR